MTELSFNTMNHSAYLGLDARLPEQVRAAAAAGYELFGPDLFSILQMEEQGTTVDELAELIGSAGMRCFEIAALAIYEDRETTMQGARELARVAHVLRPEWVMANGFADLSLPELAHRVAVALKQDRNRVNKFSRFHSFVIQMTQTDVIRLFLFDRARGR